MNINSKNYILGFNFAEQERVGQINVIKNFYLQPDILHFITRYIDIQRLISIFLLKQNLIFVIIYFTPKKEKIYFSLLKKNMCLS